MKLEEIRSLAKILNEENLSRIEVIENGNKIRIDKCSGDVCPGNASAAVKVLDKEDGTQKSGNCGKGEQTNYKEIKSPMVGVFYAASSPESEPYVKVGNYVKKGDVLCIIEAMKLLNELNSDMDGEIAEICAENGQVVEYGQTLFKLR